MVGVAGEEHREEFELVVVGLEVFGGEVPQASERLAQEVRHEPNTLRNVLAHQRTYGLSAVCRHFDDDVVPFEVIGADIPNLLMEFGVDSTVPDQVYPFQQIGVLLLQREQPGLFIIIGYLRQPILQLDILQAEYRLIKDFFHGLHGYLLLDFKGVDDVVLLRLE